MILRADARALPVRDGCIDCCVTSPPYFGLRDYGNPQQIGLEATPEAYVATIVGVFREVGRVLKDSGTLWLNLGDSYAGSSQTGGTAPSWGCNRIDIRVTHAPRRSCPADLKSKDLIGIPWMVAFALRADGWYLRSDIIWYKPNPMPESVMDRPTKAHEYVFLLAKSERYYYDAAAIAERATGLSRLFNGSTAAKSGANGDRNDGGRSQIGNHVDIRNRRSVWTVTTAPYAGAHFATFPEALIEPCILAGCPEGGLVLDPFLGSGTVGAVAERFGRRWVGTDLTYHALARVRTAQRGLVFV